MVNFKFRYLKNLYDFMGPRVVALLASGIFTGFFLFLLEVAFAYGIQSFLWAIGAMKDLDIPSWVPSASLKSVLIFILVIGTIRGVLQAVQLFLQGAIVEVFAVHQRKRILNWAFHKKSVSTSEVMSLAYEQTEAGGAVSMSIMSLLVQFTICLLIFINLCQTSLLLTAIAFGLVLVVSLPFRVTTKKIKTAGEKISQEWNITNQKLLMSIKNLLLMQIYGTQDKEEEAVRRSLNEYKKQSVRYQALSSIKFAVPQISGVIIICLLTISVNKKVDLAPGAVIFYFYLFVRFLQSYSTINFSVSHLSRFQMRAYALYRWWADRYREDQKQQNLEKTKKEADSFHLSGAPAWKLSNVSYSYGGEEEVIFKDININIAKNSLFVITGPSGSGKSTLLSLLLGLLSPTKGSVYLVDKEEERLVSDVKRGLLSKIGYVSSDSFIIQGTIKENLLYGSEDQTKIDDRLIEKALHLAECKFVYDLPEKLNYFLTEQGTGLSAGQKQRLALARALIRQPLVLVLDEATSNLDEETEEKLIKTFVNLKSEMTVLCVTHRLRISEFADERIHFKI